MAVTRDDVVQTAIQLLEEVGLDGLTLRRLATELGISAPTLYWHVKDKRELLDLMGEQMIRASREKMPAYRPGLSWDEKIAEGMRRQYEAIISWRDGARVVAGNRPTEASLPYIEQFLGVWVEAGFPAAEALAHMLSFGDFITGSALEHQAELERRRMQPNDQSGEMWKHLEAFPHLQAAVAGRGAGAAAAAKSGRPNTNFERGLRLLMSGLRLRHAELTAEKAKAALEVRPANSNQPS